MRARQHRERDFFFRYIPSIIGSRHRKSMFPRFIAFAADRPFAAPGAWPRGAATRETAFHLLPVDRQRDPRHPGARRRPRTIRRARFQLILPFPEFTTTRQPRERNTMRRRTINFDFLCRSRRQTDSVFYLHFERVFAVGQLFFAISHIAFV